jgi:hypothetical protein
LNACPRKKRKNAAIRRGIEMCFRSPRGTPENWSCQISLIVPSPQFWTGGIGTYSFTSFAVMKSFCPEVTLLLWVIYRRDIPYAIIWRLNLLSNFYLCLTVSLLHGETDRLFQEGSVWKLYLPLLVSSGLFSSQGSVLLKYPSCQRIAVHLPEFLDSCRMLGVTSAHMIEVTRINFSYS